MEQDAASLVVLDNFIGETELRGLLETLAGPDHSLGHPPQTKWERNTADDAHGSMTWGLKPEVLSQMNSEPTEAMVEVQSRLVGHAPDCLGHVISQALACRSLYTGETDQIGKDLQIGPGFYLSARQMYVSSWLY